MSTGTEIKANEYKCDRCGNVYKFGWTQEEAKKEFENNFGRPLSKDDAVICDDCYKKIMPKIYN